MKATEIMDSIKRIERVIDTEKRIGKHTLVSLKAYAQGRLDLIEEEMKFFDDSWIQNSQDRIASENWQIVQDRLEYLKSERKKLRVALGVQDE